MISEMVPVGRITIPPGRHRKDMGDLDGLARSIEESVLIHPIVIDENYTLLAGERRLRACRDKLGWTEIEAKIVAIADPLKLEHDENEIRKDFAPSERVAIADAMVAKIGNRSGERTDIHPPQPVAERPQVGPRTKTRDVAASAGGFTSTIQYRRAKRVTQRGVPELVDAMDSGEISITRAAEIATLPEEEQMEQVEKRRPGRKPKADPKPEPEPAPAPPEANPLAAGAGNPQDAVASFADAIKKTLSLAADLTRLAATPGGAKLRRYFRTYRRGHDMEYRSIHLLHLKDLLTDCKPSPEACPSCAGSAGQEGKCKTCSGDGWLSHGEWKKARKEQRRDTQGQ